MLCTPKWCFIYDCNNRDIKARKLIVKQICLPFDHKLTTDMRKVRRWVKKADEDRVSSLSIADIKTVSRQLILSRTVQNGNIIYNGFNRPLDTERLKMNLIQLTFLVEILLYYVVPIGTDEDVRMGF